MRHATLAILALAGMLASSSCVRADTRAGDQDLVGWYVEHGGAGSFQPCGSDQAWPIADPGGLPARARAFGLQADTPVYVKLRGAVRRAGGAGTSRILHVREVVQFGSPVPVRDCPMNGVVIPDAPSPSASR